LIANKRKVLENFFRLVTRGRGTGGFGAVRGGGEEGGIQKTWGGDGKRLSKKLGGPSFIERLFPVQGGRQDVTADWWWGEFVVG